MEMVKTYPKLSPFQQVLLRGLSEGVLVEGDVERLKQEGVDLTLKTVERFFRASARKESYSYAVRLIDSIISYYLSSHPGDAVWEVKREPLSRILREGVLELRKLSQLPTVEFLPRRKGDLDLVDLLVEKAEKLHLSTNDALEVLEEEINQRKKIDASITLAEFFILRVQGQVHDFRDELCDSICNSQFLATIYGLAVGPYLTRGILKQLARRKRPSLEEAGTRLRAHKAEIPLELQAVYCKIVGSFLRSQDAKAFFGNKSPISVFTGQQGMMYFAERSADAFNE